MGVLVTHGAGHDISRDILLKGEGPIGRFHRDVDHSFGCPYLTSNTHERISREMGEGCHHLLILIVAGFPRDSQTNWIFTEDESSVDNPIGVALSNGIDQSDDGCLNEHQIGTGMGVLGRLLCAVEEVLRCIDGGIGCNRQLIQTGTNDVVPLTGIDGAPDMGAVGDDIAQSTIGATGVLNAISIGAEAVSIHVDVALTRFEWVKDISTGQLILLLLEILFEESLSGIIDGLFKIDPIDQNRDEGGGMFAEGIATGVGVEVQHIEAAISAPGPLPIIGGMLELDPLLNEVSERFKIDHASSPSGPSTGSANCSMLYRPIVPVRKQ